MNYFKHRDIAPSKIQIMCEIFKFNFVENENKNKQ